MITLGFSFVVPIGAMLPSTLVQGPAFLQGIAAFENLPWREIGLTAAVLLGAWLIRRVGRLFIGRTVEDRMALLPAGWLRSAQAIRPR